MFRSSQIKLYPHGFYLRAFKAFHDFHQLPENKADTRLSKMPQDEFFEKQIMSGCCLGLSVCMGLHQSLGELPAWVEQLNTTATWDGKKSSLFEHITLKSNGKIYQRYDLMVEVIEKVVGHQHKFYAEKNIAQTKVEDVLTFKDANGRTRRLESSNTLSGGFYANMLTSLFDQPSVKAVMQSSPSFALILGLSHASLVYFEEGAWLFYEPNFTDENRLGVLRRFQNTDDLAKAILSVKSIGSNMGIQMNCLNPTLNIEPVMTETAVDLDKTIDDQEAERIMTLMSHPFAEWLEGICKDARQLHRFMVAKPTRVLKEGSTTEYLLKTRTNVTVAALPPYWLARCVNAFRECYRYYDKTEKQIFERSLTGILKTLEDKKDSYAYRVLSELYDFISVPTLTDLINQFSLFSEDASRSPCEPTRITPTPGQ